MNLKDEVFAARGYAFIDPTTSDGMPFPAMGALFDYAAAARCEELARLARFDPYEALSETSGNTLFVVKWDLIDEQLPWSGCRIIHRIDATDFLCRYARQAALMVLDRWSPPQSVRKFLQSGDLGTAVTVLNMVRIGKQKGCTDEQIHARGAARFAAMGALLAYKNRDEKLGKGLAALCGMAIYAAGAIRQDLPQQFNRSVLQMLAKITNLVAPLDEARSHAVQ
jgi:hypothetical protein